MIFFLPIRIIRKKNQQYQLQKAAAFISLVLSLKLLSDLNLFLTDVGLCYIALIDLNNFYMQVLLNSWLSKALVNFDKRWWRILFVLDQNYVQWHFHMALSFFVLLVKIY